MKHLLKLYPKRWRDRYGAEIGAFLERQRLSVAGVLDLLRGAADAHLHPSLASELVFVPTIGFRPGGTRTLLERAEASADLTHVTILAVAATPERTELIIEWEQEAEPLVCAVPEEVAPHLTAPPAETEVKAVVVAGSKVLETSSMWRQAYRASGSGSWAIRSMVFPPLPPRTARAELRVSQGELHWTVPFRLVPGRIMAAPVAAEAARHGITVRVTGVAHHDDQLILAVEASAAHAIGRIGAPAPAMPILPSGRKFKVERGSGFEPIVLEDDLGIRREEIRRIYPTRDERLRHEEGEPFVQRFSMFFDAPSTDARSAALVVPFVEVTDQTPSIVVDLRGLPRDVELGEHRFRVLSAEAYEGSDHRQIRMEIAPSTGSPRFMQPASVQGAAGGNYAWNGPSEPGEPMWMATAVGDPPIVTFRGAVLRYDSPWRLELPLVRR